MAKTDRMRRVEKLWDKLERKGIRPERLQLEWISAAEGQKFAKVMKRVEEMTFSDQEIDKLLPIPLRRTGENNND